MSNNSNYSANLAERLLSHSDIPVQLFRDVSKKSGQLEVDAWVASGDIFAMLATALDAITGLLTEDKKTVNPQLEHQINTLLYLQRHYQVIRKKSDYRQ